MQNDLKAQVEMVLRHKWAFIVVAAAVMAAGSIYFYLREDVYKALAVFKFEARLPIKMMLISEVV